MLATAAALTEAAVIKGKRDEPGRAQQLGVGTGDLLLDPGEGPGQHDAGPPAPGPGFGLGSRPGTGPTPGSRRSPTSSTPSLMNVIRRRAVVGVSV